MRPSHLFRLLPAILLPGLLSATDAGAETRLRAALASDEDGEQYRSVSLDTTALDVLGLGFELAGSSGEGVEDTTRAFRFELRSAQIWTLQIEYRRHGETGSIELDDYSARLVRDAAEWTLWGGVAAGTIRIFPVGGGQSGVDRFDTTSLGWEAGFAWWADPDWFVQAGLGYSDYVDDLAPLVDDPRSADVFSLATLGVAAGLERANLNLRVGRLMPGSSLEGTLSRSESAVDGAALDVLEVGYRARLGERWDYRVGVGVQADDNDQGYFATASIGYAWPD